MGVLFVDGTQGGREIAVAERAISLPAAREGCAGDRPGSCNLLPSLGFAQQPSQQKSLSLEGTMSTPQLAGEKKKEQKEDYYLQQLPLGAPLKWFL